ncbi:nuclear transport factor 2 family protein [Bradyrhizobium sp. HKCCYLS1011]|uniref:nuclear transport factor 2 family protein n=1 Tax=Bradyrhizobium sp. HKCCYLS1011 TaxID=3420733 RepID=UPI003EBA788F
MSANGGTRKRPTRLPSARMLQGGIAPMSNNLSRAVVPTETSNAIERVYSEWDRAWSNDDLDAMIALYAPDAVLESPLVPYMLGGDRGVIKGREQIRKLLDKAAPRKPEERTFHRRGYFTDGQTLVWEYPRAAPDGEQMDFFEVMEIKEGLIQAHRVYWGWRGVEVLKADAYYKGSD